jgi:hypothetical protein
MSMDRVKLAKVLYHVAGVVAGQAKTSVGHRAGYCRLASAVGISPTSALVQRAIYREAKYESRNTSEAKQHRRQLKRNRNPFRGKKSKPQDATSAETYVGGTADFV